jgi:hypothetical protein
MTCVASSALLSRMSLQLELQTICQRLLSTIPASMKPLCAESVRILCLQSEAGFSSTGFVGGSIPPLLTFCENVSRWDSNQLRIGVFLGGSTLAASNAPLVTVRTCRGDSTAF